ncbi:MAG: site-specific DNA-methyltransferase [Chloroflexi bacterium]|nr:site-specific DNA-methyltransferase [Chloroflexota bacterium]
MTKRVETNTIHHGDCREILQTLPDESVDFIVTSPPYADRRKHTYGGVPPEKYVEWFLPITAELLRVLKPEGSFVLNIKERVIDGERGTYVMELVLAMRKQGWFWIEEYCWHKKNCYPGKWPNRFRDAWEHCYHFAKQKHFKMYQESVMVPMGDWAERRLKYLTKNDVVRDESRSKSGFGKRVANWIGRELVYPTNVLHLATEVTNKNHSAVFPLELPTWFIKLFTQDGDVVLDPFMGSGTTARAAIKLNRKYIGIELQKDYIEIANTELQSEQPKMFAESKPKYTTKKKAKK